MCVCVCVLLCRASDLSYTWAVHVNRRNTIAETNATESVEKCTWKVAMEMQLRLVHFHIRFELVIAWKSSASISAIFKIFNIEIHNRKILLLKSNFSFRPKFIPIEHDKMTVEILQREPSVLRTEQLMSLQHNYDVEILPDIPWPCAHSFISYSNCVHAVLLTISLSLSPLYPLSSALFSRVALIKRVSPTKWPLTNATRAHSNWLCRMQQRFQTKRKTCRFVIREKPLFSAAARTIYSFS